MKISQRYKTVLQNYRIFDNSLMQITRLNKSNFFACCIVFEFNNYMNIEFVFVIIQ